MDEVGRDEVTGRPLFVVSAATPDDIPASLPVPSPHFVCLLAWDARGVSAVDVGSVAERLLRAGCAYAVCWGPDCERLHPRHALGRSHQRLAEPRKLALGRGSPAPRQTPRRRL